MASYEKCAQCELKEGQEGDIVCSAVALNAPPGVFPLATLARRERAYVRPD